MEATSGSFRLRDMQQLCRLMAELVEVPATLDGVDIELRYDWYHHQHASEEAWPPRYSGMRHAYVQYVSAGLVLLKRGKGKGKGEGKGRRWGDGPYGPGGGNGNAAIGRDVSSGG